MKVSVVKSVFLEDEQGQDMVEYTLLLAFFVLVGVALYIGVSQNINGIWTGVSNRIANSN
jgi:Flp pilus assembly pilin Flp